MNANENLDNKRKDTIAVVKFGVVLMMISMMLLLIRSFYIYVILISDHQVPAINPSGFFGFLPFEGLIFVNGLVVFLIGRFMGLLKMQKANENLKQKRNEIIGIVKFGVILMSIGIIPLIYFYAIFNPIRDPLDGIPETALNPLFFGTVLFVLGLVVVLIIGVLSLVLFLIDLLKKQESL